MEAIIFDGSMVVFSLNQTNIRTKSTKVLVLSPPRTAIWLFGTRGPACRPRWSWAATTTAKCDFLWIWMAFPLTIPMCGHVTDYFSPLAGAHSRCSPGYRGCCCRFSLDFLCASIMCHCLHNHSIFHPFLDDYWVVCVVRMQGNLFSVVLHLTVV